jgi:hypothetical protein
MYVTLSVLLTLVCLVPVLAKVLGLPRMREPRHISASHGGATSSTAWPNWPLRPVCWPACCSRFWDWLRQRPGPCSLSS